MVDAKRKFIAHNTTSYTFHNTAQTRAIHQNLSWSSDDLIYMINCKRYLKKDATLPLEYIGQTGHTLWYVHSKKAELRYQ